MKRKIVLLFVFLQGLLHFEVNLAEAFDDNAHTLLSQRAVNASALDGFITNQFPEFLRGINEQLDGRAIIDLIADGAIDEDKPLVRVRHHFHDPTKTWDQAGLLGVQGIQGGRSSAVWGQSNQAIGGSYSWHDARSYYLTALTSSAATYTERKRIYAALFRSIGHLIHLVQDAGSPAHTRNDWHISYHTVDPDYFHIWADSPDGLSVIAGSGVARLNPTSLSGTQNSFAPIPIARLIDTEKYRNDSTPRATTDIGLAEYSHANFFSDDTVVSNYLNPASNSVDLCIQGNRYYLCKNRNGETGYKIAAVTSYYNYLTPGFSEAMVDHEDTVMADYGRLLFPRAIGYSVDLIDYFFRGKIEIEAPARYVYSLAKYETGNTGFFTKMRFKVKNATEYPSTMEDTVGAGQMWAVVRYRKPLNGDLIENPFGNLSDPFYAVSDPKTATLSRTTAEEHTFDFSGSNRIPTNAADIFLMVVWQGKLGMEDGAVLVGGKDLLEPNPLDFGDGSDYDCYKQNLYHVADLGSYPPYSSSQTQRDIDGPGGQKDGIPDIFGPFFTNNQFIKAYDPAEPKAASPSLYDFKVSQHRVTMKDAQFSRFMVLQEKPVYNFSWSVDSLFDVPTQTTVPNAGLFDFTAAVVFNDHVVDSAGNRIRRVSSSFKYRTVSTFKLFMFVEGGMPRFGPCMSASFSIQEPFTRVEGDLAPE